jgi:hypothetical protein
VSIYGRLYGDCLRRAWKACLDHPWTFAIPVVLLGARAVLVARVMPIPDVGPLLVALATALLWTAYFVVLRRLSFGWRASWSQTTAQLERRGADIAALIRPALSGAIVFLALEYAGCFGSLVLCAATIGPVIELLALRDAEPTEALGRSLVFLKDRPFVWAALQLGLVTAVSLAWLIITGPLSLALELLVSPDVAWLSAFAGALVLGPVLHVMFVFRGVLFLEVERTTHAQRLYRERLAGVT